MAKEDKKKKSEELLKIAKQAPQFIAPKQEKDVDGKMKPANAPHAVGTGKQAGRPTDKKEGIEYVRLSCRISKDLRKRLRSCTTELKNNDEVKSQDGVIVQALDAFLRSKGF